MYKFIEITYDNALDDYIDKLLEKAEIERYSKIPSIHTKWSEELRHLNNSTWPGLDLMVIVILENKKAVEFCDYLKKLKKEVDIEFRAVVMPVEEII